MAELVLYTNPTSRGRIARWMLEEIGQPYRTEVLGFGAPMKDPAYLALNPMGKVPTVVHGETVVTECAAICAYLADAFPQAGLAPAQTEPARGPYLRWLFYAAGPVEAAVTNHAFGFSAPDKASTLGYGSYRLVMDVLDGLLSQQDYVLGDRFSAADVYLGAQIGFGLRFGSFEKRPSFERYAERLYGRPAAIRANQIDDALMKAA